MEELGSLKTLKESHRREPQILASQFRLVISKHGPSPQVAGAPWLGNAGNLVVKVDTKTGGATTRVDYVEDDQELGVIADHSIVLRNWETNCFVVG